MFQKITHIGKKKSCFLMIPNENGCHYLAEKETISVIKRNNV